MAIYHLMDEEQEKLYAENTKLIGAVCNKILRKCPGHWWSYQDDLEQIGIMKLIEAISLKK